MVTNASNAAVPLMNQRLFLIHFQDAQWTGNEDGAC